MPNPDVCIIYAPVTVLYLVCVRPKRTWGLFLLTSGMSAGVGAPGVALGSPVMNDTSILEGVLQTVRWICWGFSPLEKGV